ncbi:gamma-glutamylcyclotransferase [Achromobacter sp. GG226]|uniref:gamma-glutamylcyclotransferase family protein n=1 Tax=Verticiella alkaliphila TaxID=2779529 RepID=UPI001C0E294A|nr:gamma-glutamylcyclotransferase family protein [Verticiella sp. GG226]MBU4610693.1 gamma-glutamylcyclotransferase [Verticiella sp. GG226]
MSLAGDEARADRIMTRPAHLFAYGILTRDDIVRAVTGRTYRMDTAVLPDYRRYGLPHPGNEVFAAIAPASGHTVPGRLLWDVTDADLAAFDRVEEIGTGYYQHAVVHVRIDGRAEPVRALAYVCGDARRATLTGDWQPEAFTGEAAATFIRDVLPRLLG